MADTRILGRDRNAGQRFQGVDRPTRAHSPDRATFQCRCGATVTAANVTALADAVATHKALCGAKDG